MHEEPESKNAILLAMFGTSFEPALAGLLNIRDKMIERFPGTAVRMAFTSNIIRRIWQQRAADREYIRSHPQIPDDVLRVRGPLAAIACLQEEGFHTIVVQAVHIAPAAEYTDLCSCVAGLASISTTMPGKRLFRHLVVGRPALGAFDSRYSYQDDLKTAARCLAADVALAAREKAGLVYFGHGSNSPSAVNIYHEFAVEMRRQYPETPIVVITLAGKLSGSRAFDELREYNVHKVLLKPFLIAAGGHVVKDMMGGHPESLNQRLGQAGFVVHPLFHGLGEQDEFARIFVQHAADAAGDAAIDLR
ncbi:MAG: sirohydrochlorin cobaltochelatase [Desulfobulbaceae bacterium]|nr:sirohydrochlorin cobaltochelatase [Desulfobulbaceae bacterium]